MKRRTLPPWSRHHEYWCAIFDGGRCDCDDRRRGDRRPTGHLGPGGAEEAKAKVRAEEEA
jgi:hypothetical protein